MRLGRDAVDILRPVPVGELTAPTRTLRPGRRIAGLETVLVSGGQEVLVAGAGGSRGCPRGRWSPRPTRQRASRRRTEAELRRRPSRWIPGPQVEWRFDAGGTSISPVRPGLGSAEDTAASRRGPLADVPRAVARGLR